MEFDQNFFSRQAATFGGETMKKLILLRVFIHGLRGIGIETVKNLVLAGPKQVVIQDNAIVEARDLGTNFYCTESDVGTTTRANACLRQLKDLNPYCEVSVHEGEVTTGFLANFSTVVITDTYDLPKIIEINEFCRNPVIDGNLLPPIGFIYAGLLGLYGFTFVDFGNGFQVNDTNGEDCKVAIISSITSEEKAVVTTHEDKRHGFEDGDHVIFREIDGMTGINGKTYPIKVISPFTFSIGDTRGLGTYERNGIAEQVKVPVNVPFKSLKQSLVQPFGKGIPYFENPDTDKWGRPELLHLTLRGVLEFHAEHKRLPELNSTEDAQILLKIVHSINAIEKNRYAELKKLEDEERLAESNEELRGKINHTQGTISVDEIDEKIVKSIAKFARAQISPSASFWGGIIAQEIVKSTGKYTPIRQWLHYENLEIIPEAEVDRTVLNSRYDDQIAIFGKEFQDKLLQLKLFLVGAGALGCEFIKMFALMGVSSSPQGKLTVTDDDNIEISNLNRQFLFRKNNVGFSKTKCACAAGIIMNSALNVEPLKMRVSPDNEEIFNDNFWEGLSAVVNAVDNVPARLYVDNRCVFYNKHLFESGTLGTKCNSQIIVPGYTQSYGDSQDPAEENIPLCTLKNFPYQIEHTIQWARDFFEGVFVEGPAETNKFIEGPEKYIKQLNATLGNQINSLRGKLETVAKFSEQFTQASHENCIQLAKEKFQELFHNMIAELLYNCPPNHVSENGQPFWTAPKRCPVVVNFDITDPTHVEFIYSTANLYAYAFGLPPLEDKHHVAKIASTIKVSEFQPKKKTIKVNPNDPTDEKGEDDEVVIENLTKLLLSKNLDSSKKLRTTEFEKDDDTNFHIDFISALANLRARNYRINEVERSKVKVIAGKIIPAIATTTAMVVGAVGIEIIKFVLGLHNSKYRNLFANLALPLWLFSETLPPIKNKDKDYDVIAMGPVRAVPQGWTNWDKILIEGPLTLAEIVKHLGDKHGLQVNMINSRKVSLYSSYSKDPNNKLALTKSPEEAYHLMSGEAYPKHKKYVELDVDCSDKDLVDCIIPRVVYKISQ